MVRVESIDNLSTPKLKSQFSEARNREYQDLIRQIQAISGTSPERKNATRLSRLRNRFQEIVDVDFFDSPLQERVRALLEQASSLRTAKTGVTAKINPKDYKNRVWVTRTRPGVDRFASALADSTVHLGRRSTSSKPSTEWGLPFEVGISRRFLC